MAILGCILCFSAISFYGYAFETTSTWMLKPLEHIDELNKKDPALALSFAKEIFKEHQQKMSNIDKASIFGKMARHNYFLGHYNDSQNDLDRAYALNVDLTTNLGVSLLLTQGGVMGELGDVEHAMEKYLLAEKYAKINENPKLLADTYAYIAHFYSNGHNDSEALKYYHQAYLLFEQIGDELNMAYLKVDMSNSYSLMFDEVKAIKLAIEASDYFNKHQYYFDELFSQNMLAKIYLRKKNYQKAELAYLRVIVLTEQANKKTYVYLAYLGLASTYHHSQQAEKARVFWKKYKEHQPDYENPAAKRSAVVLEAKLAIADNNIKKAINALTELEVILKPLNIKTAVSWYVELFDLQAKIAIKQNDYQTAYFKQKKARELQKDYYHAEREIVRSKYKVMFDTDQALLKNKLLERDKQLDKSALENAAQQQKLQSLLISAMSIFALALIFFIYHQRKNSKILHKLANTDALTELANRRYTFIYAENMLAQSKKYQQSFAIIIFDIDHFKKINDTYGHTGGDIALKGISDIANEYVRSNDILGRIGGEEFLVILPNTSSKQAYDIAERIRQGIEKADITLGDEIVNISASFGISQLTQNQPNFNQIFHEADIALYQAKNSGRNCITLAG